MNLESSNPPEHRFVRGDSDGNYDNPNAGISEELRIAAAVRVLMFLWYFRVDVHYINTDDGPEWDFFLVKAGDSEHLIYIRVTIEDEEEEGAGPMPGILIDQAQELNAQPHVLRVHLRWKGDKVPEELFGHEALAREWKAAAWWRRTLLRGRTARDCLRLVGGRPSKLKVLIQQKPPGNRPPKPCEAKGRMAEKPPDYSAGSLELALRMEPSPRTHLRGQICMEALVVSTHRSDRFFLFLWPGGIARYAGIPGFVEVVHEDGLVVWRLLGSTPRRLLVFEHDQYREEILTKVRRALALHRKMRPGAILGTNEEPPQVSQTLFLAEEGGV